MDVADALLATVAVVALAIFTASHTVAAEVHCHLAVPGVSETIVDDQLFFIIIISLP